MQSALAELDRLDEERGRIGAAFGRLSSSDAVLKARRRPRHQDMNMLVSVASAGHARVLGKVEKETGRRRPSQPDAVHVALSPRKVLLS